MLTYEEQKAINARCTEYLDEVLHRRFRVVVDAIRPGSRVLDIACGSGTLMQALRDKNCQVRGIDLAPGAVALARAKGLDVMVGDVDAFETDSGVRTLLLDEYDAVIFSKCLVYLKQKNELLPRLKASNIYVVQSNPIYWRLLLRRLRGGEPAQLADRLPYVRADGRLSSSHSHYGLSQWASSYGYRSRVLTGGTPHGHDRVTHFFK